MCKKFSRNFYTPNQTRPLACASDGTLIQHPRIIDLADSARRRSPTTACCSPPRPSAAGRKAQGSGERLEGAGTSRGDWGERENGRERGGRRRGERVKKIRYSVVGTA